MFHFMLKKETSSKKCRQILIVGPGRANNEPKVTIYMIALPDRERISGRAP